MEEQCSTCGGKNGRHEPSCPVLDDDQLVLSHIDGDIAGRRGEPRAAPEGISEDAAWTWLSAYDRAVKEMVDRRQAV